MAQPPLSSSVQPTEIYGGDEVSALVLDPGYCSTRAGFAGEELPKQVLPSFYGHVDRNNPHDLFGDEIMIPRDNFSVRNYMNRDGIVEDWDAATKLWEHMLVGRLQPPRQTSSSRNGRSDDVPDALGDIEMKMEGDDLTDLLEKPLAENPLLITEPPWNPSMAREKAIEISMETWGCPAFWLGRSPVLAAFAAGKPTALVVDVGGANTSVTAVLDGMVLKRSVQKSPIGGLWLSDQVRCMWQANDPRINIVPAFLVENKRPVDAGAPADVRLRKFDFPISDTFRAYEEHRVLTEFKESVVEVWRGPGRYYASGNEDYVRSQPGRVFEMPDGSNQMWREQRYRVSEPMLDDNAPIYGGEGNRVAKNQTIPALVKQSLEGVDVDVRPLLLSNIVVTGSTSLLNGFNDRLNMEVQNFYPGLKIKITSAGLTSERRFGAWIGGSILASLGTFHQMWISRKEYEESGASVVDKRCK